MAEIDWREEFDSADNSVWVAEGPYDDPPTFWALRQKVCENRIVWYPDHSPELGGDHRDYWLTLEEAKADCQKAHDHIIRCESEESANDA